MTDTEYNARFIYSTGKFVGRRWVFFTEGVDDGASPVDENCDEAGRMLRPGERAYVVVSISVWLPPPGGLGARVGQWLVVKFGCLKFFMDGPEALLLHDMRLPFVSTTRHSIIVRRSNTVSAEVRLPWAVGWLLRLCPFLRPSTIRIKLDGVAVSERTMPEYLQ